MKEKTKTVIEIILGIFGCCLTVFTLLFGDNLFQQITGHSVFQNSTSSVTETPALISLGQSPTMSLTETLTSLPVSTTELIVFDPHPDLSDFIDESRVPMRLIPGGEFTMGSNDEENWAKPAHKIYLGAYYIDKYEVTNILYRECVIVGACEEPFNTERYNDLRYANHPIVYIDWYQANTYCIWRGGQLPTESQWEKAASGTDEHHIYPWGNAIDCKNANHFHDTSLSFCVGTTTVIGNYEFGKSPYGVYDMAGNVLEWVLDWFEVYPGGDASVANFGAIEKVVRGGGWSSFESDLRVTYRLSDTPDTNINDDIGFRCARDANP